MYYKDIICFGSVAFVVFIMVMLISYVCCLANKGYDDEEYWDEYWEKENKNMSEQNRTPKEYIERYAKKHTDDDQEVAAEHAMVKEVLPTLKEE